MTALVRMSDYWKPIVEAITGAEVQVDSGLGTSGFRAHRTGKSEIRWDPYCVGLKDVKGASSLVTLMHEVGHALDPESHAASLDIFHIWTECDPDTVLRVEGRAWKIAEVVGSCLGIPTDDIRRHAKAGYEWYAKKVKR